MRTFATRAFTVGAVCIGSVIMAVVPAGAASGPGAEKLPLVGPEADVFCDSLQPVPGENAGTDFPGFAIFNQNGNAGTVMATVSVKGWQPDTSYPVRLIQGGDDCFTVDGVIETNGRGNGTLHVEEAQQPGSTAMQVIVDTGALFGTPSIRATEAYELQ